MLGPSDVSQDPGLTELAAPFPVPRSASWQSDGRRSSHRLQQGPENETLEARFDDEVRDRKYHVKDNLDLLFTMSFIIIFSFFGVLARLGLGALLTYEGQPVNAVIWAQLIGCFVVGFLVEDDALFPKDNRFTSLYVGLVTGFCGSLTTFSTWMMTCFTAMANVDPSYNRTVRDNVAALLAQVLLTLAISLFGLRTGAHVAVATSLIPGLPHITANLRLPWGYAGIVVAIGMWIGAVLATVFMPSYRGTVLLALVFGPPGSLLRFFLSRMNPWVRHFPLGTFLANQLGTILLAAFFLEQYKTQSVLACQILQGLEDGFCGCLTTVSTFIVELSTLSRARGWLYGIISVITGVLFFTLTAGIDVSLTF